MTREEAIQKRDIVVTQFINELGVTIETNTKPLIRCKNCKWHMNDYMGEWCGKLRGHPGMKANDFCSYGERRGGDDE